MTKQSTRAKLVTSQLRRQWETPEHTSVSSAWNRPWGSLAKRQGKLIRSLAYVGLDSASSKHVLVWLVTPDPQSPYRDNSCYGDNRIIAVTTGGERTSSMKTRFLWKLAEVHLFTPSSNLALTHTPDTPQTRTSHTHTHTHTLSLLMSGLCPCTL